MSPAKKNSHSALEAISLAQQIAFGPILFQAVWSLRESGLLAALDRAPHGLSVAEAAVQTSMSHYAVSVLFDMAVSGQILAREEDRVVLTAVGHYLLHDAMTRINMDFTQHVCYQAMGALLPSLQQGKPLGLGVFGDWPTLYPGLSQLPEEARRSWFAFDHFYSDRAFAAALPHILDLHPRHLYDVGGNTGKWAMTCATADPALRVTILDLPPQLALAMTAIQAAGLTNRIDGHAIDLLTDASLPGEADLWWMSQFLDCFSEEQILSLLRRVRHSMKPGARLAILELFHDRQPYAAAEFSLNATSLYFTCLANGNSRFYHSAVFIGLLQQAGFVIEQEFDQIGRGHTLLIASPGL